MEHTEDVATRDTINPEHHGAFMTRETLCRRRRSRRTSRTSNYAWNSLTSQSSSCVHSGGETICTNFSQAIVSYSASYSFSHSFSLSFHVRGFLSFPLPTHPFPLSPSPFPFFPILPVFLSPVLSRACLVTERDHLPVGEVRWKSRGKRHVEGRDALEGRKVCSNSLSHAGWHVWFVCSASIG